MSIKQTALMDKHELIAVFKRIIENLERDDSFEGRVSYTCLSGEENSEIPDGKFEVNAFVRYGNSCGQGFAFSTLHLDMINS